MITTLACDVNANGVRNLSPRWCAVALHSLRTNHLGNVAAVANSAGVYVVNSYAVYEPFGAFSVQPTATNPSVSDRGFTGHRQNNTGAYPTQNVGLIYMISRPTKGFH